MAQASNNYAGRRPAGFWALCLVVVAVAAGLGPLTGQDRRWVGVGTDAAVLATVALGVNLLLGYTGLLSLGHAGFFVVGGYVGSVWTPAWGLPPWAGLLTAFGAGLLGGGLLGLACCHLRGLYLTVVTFGLGGLLPQLALALQALAQGTSASTVDRPITTDDGLLLSIATGVLLTTLWLCRNVLRSRWGRALTAIRESEAAARACGVRAYWCKVASFALSAGIVAVAGMVQGQRVLAVSAVGTQDLSFRFVVLVVVGGAGTLAGPVAGAALVTFGLANAWLQRTFADSLGLLYGSLGLLVVALAPEGAVGLVRRLGGWREELTPPPVGLPATPLQPARAAAAGPLLELAGVNKRYRAVDALTDVDLRVTAGTIHALIGPNGSGKTTLLDVVTGFTKPDAGVVRFEGADMGGTGPARRSEAGMARTFQDARVWRRMTVLDNVLVGAHRRGRVGLARSALATVASRREERRLRERARHLLDFVGLRDEQALAGELTLAQQRRLELARAVASSPLLVAIDEPAAGLQPWEVWGLMAVLEALRAAGTTLLLVEHRMELVMLLSDAVTVLDFGRKIAEGKPSAVKADPLVVSAYLGQPS